jgi:tRNA(Ile)-lysidine synthase
MARQSPALEQRVLNFIRQYRLIKEGSCLVVAVSGGPDSTCLLHLLVGLRQELGIELHVAHLDHRLRGRESEADAAYVAHLAERLGMPATIERRDAKAYQKEKRISLEEAAREVRYRFLADTAEAINTSYIATGHTLDDQVETILMHIIRGTGTRGLVGLKPLSQWQINGRKLNIIRPLLEVSRRQTAEYCRRYELMPRLDSSNLSLSSLRNRIRQQLVPLLESYNTDVTAALCRMATTATDEITFLDAEVARLWPDVASEQPGLVMLDRDVFHALPPALKRHLLRVVIENILGNLKDIETRHIEEIMDVLDKPAGKQISLPGGLIFYVEYDRYLLGVATVNTCPYPVIGGEYSINIPGQTELPGWRVEAEVIGPSFGKGEGLLTNDFTACLDLGKTGKDLKVRRRKPGDRFQPLGMAETKKLNEFMIDARIPRSWRGRIPVVFSPRHIVWLVGYRIDDRAKVTEDTKQVLRLQFKRC